MTIKQSIKHMISAAGWSVKRTRNLPTGIDLGLDLKRMVLECQPSIIFDVGANIGQTSTWLHDYFPSSTIHAFEPVPETYKNLVKTTRHLQNIECHQFALGSKPSRMNISAIPNEERNSLVTGIFDDHPESQQVTIEVQTADIFCKEHNIDKIDILKTDTEGFDVAVIEGAAELLSNQCVSAVISEITFDSSDSLHSSFHELFAILGRYGFLPCGFYETERLFRNSTDGTYCNALFVRQDLLSTL